MLKISVSSLCFGTMTFGNKGIFKSIGFYERSDCITLTKFLYDAGIRKFDTAYGYSDGLSERILGDALKPYTDVHISSKVSKSIHSSKPIDLSFKNIIKSCEISLKNLNVEQIDLLYLHGFDPSVPIEESISALEWLCDHDMIAEYGVCNFTGYQLMKAIDFGTDRFTSVQYKSSFLEKNYTWDIIDLSNRNKISIYGYSTLAGGLLTGKYIHHPDNKKFRFNRLKIKIKEEYINKIKSLYTLSQTLNTPIEWLAIQSVISDLDYIIIGLSNLAQAKHILRFFSNE